MKYLAARWYQLLRMFLTFVALLLVASTTRADSLSARATTDVLQVGEPIIVQVTLRLDQPYRRHVEDAREAAKQARRLKHSLVAELWDRDQRVASASIGGVSFVAAQDGCNELNATVMGWFGVEEPGEHRSRFRFWTDPGRFRVIVKGKESGLEAEGFSVDVTPAANPTAAQLLVAGELDALALLFLQHEHGEGAVAAFERLARDYPETVHAQYARIVLAIRAGAKARTRSHRLECEVELGALANELQAASAVFEEGHPLRSRALFELAHVLLRNKERDRAVDAARSALSESKEGGLCDAAKQLLDAIVRRSQAQTPLKNP